VPRSLQDEVNQSPYDRVLQESVRGELRMVNAGLPRSHERDREEKTRLKRVKVLVAGE
jgi:hypothetical protein